MIKGNRQIAYNYYISSPILKATREIKNASDWGDQATVGIQLKRMGATVYSSDTSFGVYLGKHNNEWIIAIYEKDYKLGSCEIWDDYDAMRTAWEAD